MRRTEGRRRLRFLVCFAAAFVVLIAALGATRTALLDVDRLIVVGAIQTPSALVLDTVGIAPGDPLVDLDLGAAGQRVAGLPWVADASVSRSWDGTVTVGVTERTAVAVVPTAFMGNPPGAPAGDPDGGRPPADPTAWSMVDGSGRVLDVLEGAPLRIPRIEGVSPAGAPGSDLAQDADAALALAVALPAGLAESVTTIASSSAGGAETGDELELVLDAGTVLRLGPATNLGDKLVAAVTVLERYPSGAACVDVLDVRVPASPALTPRLDCA